MTTTSRRIRWSLIAALLFGATAAIIAIPAGFLVGFTHPFPGLVVLSASLTGGALWYLVIERPSLDSVLAGGVVGVLTGLLAHVPLWLLFGLWDPQSFVEHWETTIPLVALSVFFGGWITVPMACAAGLLTWVVRDHYVE